MGFVQVSEPLPRWEAWGPFRGTPSSPQTGGEGQYTAPPALAEEMGGPSAGRPPVCVHSLNCLRVSAGLGLGTAKSIRRSPLSGSGRKGPERCNDTHTVVENTSSEHFLWVTNGTRRLALAELRRLGTECVPCWPRQIGEAQKDQAHPGSHSSHQQEPRT